MFNLIVSTSSTVLEDTGLSQQQLDLVLDGIQLAAEVWGRYIDAPTANIDLALSFEDLSGNSLAEAGANFFSFGGPFLSEVIEELNGRQDSGGALSYGEIDANLTIDLPKVLSNAFHYSDDLEFDANPGLFGQTDFLTLIVHELGHSLGFLSLTFDPFLVGGDFTGANAVAANGGPVDLADGVHLVGPDLLSPSLTNNTRETVTDVHIAILKDLGLPIAESSGSSDTLYGFHLIDDTLDGLDGNDLLIGLTGNDTLNGDAGSDILRGGVGNDVLNGGADGDRLEGGDDNDTLLGGTGTDVLIGGLGNDIINGETGFDTALYTGLATGVTVDLSITAQQNTGGAGLDTLTFIENLVGSGQGDTLTGSSNRNRLEGNNGDDTLFGLDNNDTLIGGSGNDTLNGGNGADRLFGSAGNDILNGNAQRDRLVGGDGNDTLFGGDDVDRLLGGDGDDMLIGGNGTDFLFGGAGNDTFIFNEVAETGVGPFQRDEIRDWEDGDQIDVSNIDANTTVSGNQAFNLVTGGFSGTAGEIMIQSLVRSGVDVQLVSFDVDGDAQIDMQIWVLASELDAGDFVL